MVSSKSDKTEAKLADDGIPEGLVINVNKALCALKDYVKKSADKTSTKEKLFTENAHLRLEMRLKRMPHITGMKYIDTVLPHGFLNPKTVSVCLFVKDLNAKEDFKDHDVEKSARVFKQMLKEEKNLSGVDEIISLSQLKREYKTFESRRRLCTAYDVFLCDDRITSSVSEFLGRSFLSTNKMPFSIRLSSSDVNREVERSLATARFMLKKLCSRFSVKFGSIEQDVVNLMENFDAVAKVTNEKVPGGFDNIRSVYIRLADVPSLPVYVSLDSGNLLKLPVPSRSGKYAVVDELTTLDADVEDDDNDDNSKKKVRVWPSGKVRVLKSKKSKKKFNKSKQELMWKPFTGGNNRKRSSNAEKSKKKTKRVKKEDPTIIESNSVS